MGLRSSRLSGTILGMLATLSFVSTVATAAETRDLGPACPRPHSTTLLETGKVRVFAMPQEPAGHSEKRHPTISGRPVFACLKATGKSRLLDLPEVGGEKSAYWVTVDERVFATNAALVAYVYSQFYLDTHETWIRVRNLWTGKVIRTCLVGGAIAPRPGPHVTDISLSLSGEVSWKVQDEQQVGGEDHVPGCNPTARSSAVDVNVEDQSAPAGEPLEQLAGHGPYRGLSIVDANGGHPVRRPGGLRLSFGTITEHSGGQPIELPVMGWKSNCNGHSYRLEATSTRLELSREVSTRMRCAGMAREEERWLGGFFRASPHWQLAGGRLILTTRGSRIVMRHLPSNSEKEGG